MAEPQERMRVDARMIASLFAPRPRDAHKGLYGPLALMGGSLPYSGAIRLADQAAAAMRGGAGVVRVCAPESICPLIAAQTLESTLFPLPDRGGQLRFEEEAFSRAIQGMKAVAFGMGAGGGEDVRQAVRFLLARYEGILMLDADGLNALAELPGDALTSAKGSVVLTPHLGEFSRLTKKSIPDIRERSLLLAEEYAKAHGIILLLKGPTTIVTDGQRTLLADRGCPGMATGGSGDVLSGILAALCAAHPREDLLLTVAAAAWLNGRAGELAQEEVGDISLIASDTIRAIPRAIRELREALSL